MKASGEAYQETLGHLRAMNVAVIDSEKEITRLQEDQAFLNVTYEKFPDLLKK